MPELPEVETVRRGLTPHMTSRVVRDVRVRVPALRWPIPVDLPECIRGEVVYQVCRRGKYLLIEFSSGWMLIHLGMSGSLRWVDPQVPVRKHDHLDLVFDHGLVRLHDPRRFGAVLWHDRSAGPVDSHPLLAKLAWNHSARPPSRSGTTSMPARVNVAVRSRPSCWRVNWSWALAISTPVKVSFGRRSTRQRGPGGLVGRGTNGLRWRFAIPWRMRWPGVAAL